MFHLRRHTTTTAIHSQRPHYRSQGRRGSQMQRQSMDSDMIGMSQTRGHFLTLNISGAIFEIRKECLSRCPDTLLGCEERREKYYDPVNNQYFFDRHRQAFEGILFYYQSEGRLVRPENVPEAVFEEEVKFFELPTGDDNTRTQIQLVPTVSDDSTYSPEESQVAWKRNLREWFDRPRSSLSAKVLQKFSLVVLMLSIVGSCLSTVEVLQLRPTKNTLQTSGSNSSSNETSLGQGLAQDPWMLSNIIFHGWFTFECLVRFIVAPDKKEYLKLYCNVVDLATIFTFYLILIAQFGLRPSSLWAAILVRVLQTLSLVLRVARLVRFSTYMEVLVLTFATGLNDLSMLMLFVITVVLLASSAVFYAETAEDMAKANFTSIPNTFWWSVVTITTIGYGDQVPATASGKVAAGVCTVLGTLIIALPLFRFASQFRDRLESLGIGHRNSTH